MSVDIIPNSLSLRYNMAGHLKFCLIATGGFLIFHEMPSMSQVIGIILTISGRVVLSLCLSLYYQYIEVTTWSEH